MEDEIATKASQGNQSHTNLRININNKPKKHTHKSWFKSSLCLCIHGSPHSSLMSSKEERISKDLYLG